jgi:hypothetical protein
MHIRLGMHCGTSGWLQTVMVTKEKECLGICLSPEETERHID